MSKSKTKNETNKVTKSKSKTKKEAQPKKNSLVEKKQQLNYVDDVKITSVFSDELHPDFRTNTIAISGPPYSGLSTYNYSIDQVLKLEPIVSDEKEHFRKMWRENTKTMPILEQLAPFIVFLTIASGVFAFFYFCL